MVKTVLFLLGKKYRYDIALYAMENISKYDKN